MQPAVVQPLFGQLRKCCFTHIASNQFRAHGFKDVEINKEEKTEERQLSAKRSFFFCSTFYLDVNVLFISTRTHIQKTVFEVMIYLQFTMACLECHLNWGKSMSF